jgi:hypothetical protein
MKIGVMFGNPETTSGRQRAQVLLVGERKLLEDVPEGEFRFYRNTSNLKACIEILNQLGLGDLKPVESLS